MDTFRYDKSFDHHVKLMVTTSTQFHARKNTVSPLQCVSIDTVVVLSSKIFKWGNDTKNVVQEYRPVWIFESLIFRLYLFVVCLWCLFMLSVLHDDLHLILEDHVMKKKKEMFWSYVFVRSICHVLHVYMSRSIKFSKRKLSECIGNQRYFLRLSSWW